MALWFGMGLVVLVPHWWLEGDHWILISGVHALSMASVGVGMLHFASQYQLERAITWFLGIVLIWGVQAMYTAIGLGLLGHELAFLDGMECGTKFWSTQGPWHTDESQWYLSHISFVESVVLGVVMSISCVSLLVKYPSWATEKQLTYQIARSVTSSLLLAIPSTLLSFLMPV